MLHWGIHTALVDRQLGNCALSQKTPTGWKWWSKVPKPWSQSTQVEGWSHDCSIYMVSCICAELSALVQTTSWNDVSVVVTLHIGSDLLVWLEIEYWPYLHHERRLTVPAVVGTVEKDRKYIPEDKLAPDLVRCCHHTGRPGATAFFFLSRALKSSSFIKHSHVVSRQIYIHLFAGWSTWNTGLLWLYAGPKFAVCSEKYLW